MQLKIIQLDILRKSNECVVDYSEEIGKFGREESTGLDSDDAQGGFATRPSTPNIICTCCGVQLGLVVLATSLVFRGVPDSGSPLPVVLSQGLRHEVSVPATKTDNGSPGFHQSTTPNFLPSRRERGGGLWHPQISFLDRWAFKYGQSRVVIAPFKNKPFFYSKFWKLCFRFKAKTHC